eukprot:g36850.t1
MVGIVITINIVIGSNSLMMMIVDLRNSVPLVMYSVGPYVAAKSDAGATFLTAHFSLIQQVAGLDEHSRPICSYDAAWPAVF